MWIEDPPPPEEGEEGGGGGEDEAAREAEEARLRLLVNQRLRVDLRNCSSLARLVGRGLHSSTSELNLTRLWFLNH